MNHAHAPKAGARALLGGPLGGLVLDVTGWTIEERAEGALLVTGRGLYGLGGRAPRGAFLWIGETS
ncbi:hypothetical protein [Streptomyces sp. NPDC056387]|uniref:hypothetical protein n=1 Tax=Streptomyces sp. NPDC056387 TaxID=3345803 RepID=UPI0035D7E878